MTLSPPRLAVERVRYATPHMFGSDVVPMKHLQQFSTRFAGNGSGALPGAVTCAAGAVTAIALGVAGINYSTTTARVIIVGDGTGAAATITGVGGGGDITGYTIDAGGAGYTSAVAYVVDGPVVVVVGDSIATEQPSQSNLGGSMWYLLTSAIQAANPLRNITFFNRAVGAQTYTNLDTTPSSNWPAWYSNHAKLWTDYIVELQPDLIIIAFGMNDRQNFVFSRFTSAITTLLAISPEPDIVLVTPMVPSAISADPDMSSDASQIGRDAVAGYVRGAALSMGFGLVDLNRRLRLVRDGLDVRHCALRRVANVSPALPWTATTEAEGDFSLDMTFTTFTLAGNTLTVELGSTGVNTRTELLIDSSGGFIRCQIRDINPNTLATTTQDTFVSQLATPTGTVGIDVIVQDQRVVVLVNDTLVYAALIKRYSGTFYPKVSYTAAETPDIIYCAGRYGRYASRMTDEDLWGTSGGGDYEGNELNHPSTLALAAVMAPVIYETDWAHSPLTIGTDATGVTTYLGGGEADPLGRWHVTKRRVSGGSRIAPSSTANTEILEDDSAPGQSLMSGNAGIARWVAGDLADPLKFVRAYNHGTDTLTDAIGGVNQVSLTANQWTATVPVRPFVGTVAQINALTGVTDGAMAYCTNDATGRQPVYYDSVAAVWKRTATNVAMA